MSMCNKDSHKLKLKLKKINKDKRKQQCLIKLQLKVLIYEMKCYIVKFQNIFIWFYWRTIYNCRKYKMSDIFLFIYNILVG
jgi:hypothetical protein